MTDLAYRVYLRYQGRAAQHPNFEEAIERIVARWGEGHRNHWTGLYNAHPHWLDLTVTCPRCGEEPYHGCVTPTHYFARTHAARLKLLG